MARSREVGNDGWVEHRPAAFLDRDGTINVAKGSVHAIRDWPFITGAIDGLRVLQSMGFESAAVKRYFEEHLRCKADHTHRLFALLQLSLWGRWLRDAGPGPTS